MDKCECLKESMVSKRTNKESQIITEEYDFGSHRGKTLEIRLINEVIGVGDSYFEKENIEISCLEKEIDSDTMVSITYLVGVDEPVLIMNPMVHMAINEGREVSEELTKKEIERFQRSIMMLKDQIDTMKNYVAGKGDY